MIRHTSSLFISIALHAVLLFTILFTWSDYSSEKKEAAAKSICIELCDVVNEKEIQKPKKEVKKFQKQEPQKIEIENVNEVPLKKEIAEEQKQKEPEKTQEEIEEKKIKRSLEEQKLKQEKLQKEYLEVNTQTIAELLQENLYYPRSARKKNITGKIIVKFTLGVDSRVYDIVVVESNSDILSRAAIKTISDLSGSFPKPKSELTLLVPIGYRLN